MKAKDKKLIAEINEKIEVLKEREDLLQNMFDKCWDEKGNCDEYRELIEKHNHEYEGIDDEIMKLRAEIRKIRDKDLIEKGYFHEMNLARANID